MEYVPVSLVQFFGPGICILGLSIGECSQAGTTIINLILPSLTFRLIMEKMAQRFDLLLSIPV